MELWVFLSMAGALFQTVRFMLQKHLSQIKLSASGATFARFLYSAPLALGVAAIYLNTVGKGVPNLSISFWAHGALGGTAQILATVFTVMLFGRRNFAVGITLKKTEVMMAALIGMVFLGDMISAFGLIALCIGLAGVLVLSGPIEVEGSFLRRLFTPSAILGLSAGAFFGVSSVSYRAASLTVSSADPFERAIVTLAAVTMMQMIAMSVWLYFRDRPEILRVLSTWKTAVFVGLTSLAGSFCWFAAFTLQNAAYVKAVGQIELIFGIAAATLFFKEKITKREIAGMALVATSIMVLVLWS
ncbi:MAG: DMT family transporter [Pseudomonadota bacterium]|nr:DMT family transporter [Pseudomonadota bacterium]